MEQNKKPIYKKWWFWVIIVILVIMVATSGGDSSNDTVITQGNTTNGSQSKQTEKTVNVGGSVQTDEVKISYTSSQEYTNYSTYAKPKSGNKVVRVEFEFENISNGDIYLDVFECYADGEKCEAYYYADDYKSPAVESLSKGKKFKAVLYYEVPTTAQNVTLEYETDYWSDEKVEFIVQ